MTKIGIIIGSTRPGRVGPQVAAWIHELAAEHASTYRILDLADFDLPPYAEPIPAAFSAEYQAENAHAWSAAVDELDGFVFVTPEYNRSMPSSLKNAIDYLGGEFFNKAAGIVSYGSSGGVMASAHLRASLSTLQVATVQSAPALSIFTDFANMTDFTPAPFQEGPVRTLLDQVESWAGALAGIRAPRVAE